MKKKYWAYAIVLILLVCNVVILLALNKVKKEAEDSISILVPYAQKYEVLSSNLKNNIEFSTHKIPDVEFIDIKLKAQKLSNIVGQTSDFLILLRVSDRYCYSCVKYCIELFQNKGISDKITMALLLGYKNNPNFLQKVEEFGLTDKVVYNCSDIESPIDYAGFPYLMVLNRELEIIYCYFPTKGSIDIDIENINMIIDNYAQKASSVSI